MSLWLILFLTLFKFAIVSHIWLRFDAHVKWPPNTCSLIDIMFCFSQNFYATSWTWIFCLQGTQFLTNSYFFCYFQILCLSNWTLYFYFECKICIFWHNLKVFISWIGKIILTYDMSVNKKINPYSLWELRVLRDTNFWNKKKEQDFPLFRQDYCDSSTWCHV